jgi:hypothetical protein
MARIKDMNSYRPPAAQDAEDAEDQRASNSYLWFLGWVGVEVVGYALLVLFASDETRACSGFCFSPQGTLVLLGLVFGLPALVGQLVVGGLLTVTYNRRRMTSLATGSASFFTTFAILVLVFGGLAVANLSHM